MQNLHLKCLFIYVSGCSSYLMYSIAFHMLVQVCLNTCNRRIASLFWRLESYQNKYLDQYLCLLYLFVLPCLTLLEASPVSSIKENDCQATSISNTACPGTGKYSLIYQTVDIPHPFTMLPVIYQCMSALLSNTLFNRLDCKLFMSRY